MPFFNPASWKGKEPKSSGLAQCGRCGLSKQCISPRMETTGRGERKVLFVAEAPGLNEDQTGKQLVGKAGQILRKAIRELKLGTDLEDCWKTNAVICRPPSNIIDDVYIDACRPNLLKTIKTLKPKVIVLLGAASVRSLLPLDWPKDIGALTRWVGWTIPSARHGAYICPTYHPSYLGRMDEDPVLMRMFKDHLRQAFKLETAERPTLTVKQLQSQVEVITSPRMGRKRMKDLASKHGRLAFDYETTGLKPDRAEHHIVSCSFCLNGTDTFACPIDEGSLPALSAVLQNKRLRKIASNLKFEERWTLAKLGHRVSGWFWDTMLAAHIIDNRSNICSVKFQAFVLLGCPDYDSDIEPYLKAKDANGMNRIHELNLHDLLVYNGMDSLLEYKVAGRQMEIMRW